MCNRLMDKYARLMQRLDIINTEFVKNTNPGGKGLNDALGYQLKTALTRIRRDCGQWVKSSSPFSSSLSTPLNMPLSHTDNRLNGIPSSNLSHVSSTSFGLKERCTAADTLSLVARILQNSKAHLHSVRLQNNAAIVDDFYAHLVYFSYLIKHKLKFF
ncbi:putative syndetin [Helianthus annuus]|nr:putative syndetin [Helianthus annuus]